MGMTIKQNLSGPWMLYYIDDGKFSEEDPTISSEPEAAAIADQVMEAIVPGNVETALQAAGVIGEPFFGMNSRQLEAFEYAHYIYVKTFDYQDPVSGNEKICFDGIDTYADIYLNGIKIGSTDNMLITHSISMPSLKRGRNELLVHIYPTVLAARNYHYTSLNLAIKYNYDALFVRKTASMYGWDIMPRIVSAGIWRPVRIVEEPSVRLLQTYLYTIYADETKARLDLFYELELQREHASDYMVTIDAVCDDHRFHSSTRVWGKCGKIQLSVDQPKLWWPRNTGEQNLYQVTVELWKCGKRIDQNKFETGIRTVELRRTGVVDENGNGAFHFLINQKPVFILGTNWVPPDALPSRGDQRAPKILDLVEDIGCNAIRIWGGSRYETEDFYHLCDQKGILIWHDFMMGCGNYPQTDEFIKRLTHELRQVVRRLRHHPSIVLWAGDNECDQNYQWQVNFTDPNQNILTREIIPNLLLNEDFTRPYLPSSPYISPECYQKGVQYITEDHLWGERKYYKADYYRNAKAVFASEMGYHGCPSPASIRKFITPEAVWPYQNNEEWMLHASSPDPKKEEPFGYRIELMANQIRVLFGEVPSDLNCFALASQISQAEAKKYFIERFRMHKWKRSGIIWWNICDGWPQFSDAVVDYYFTKKLAYGYIKRSQQPFCIMVDEPAGSRCRLVAVNDTTQDQTVHYTVKSMKTGAILVEDRVTVENGPAKELQMIPYSGEQDLLLLEWEGDGAKGCNTYLLGEPCFDFNQYVEMASRCGVLTLEGFDEALTMIPMPQSRIMN